MTWDYVTDIQLKNFERHRTASSVSSVSSVSDSVIKIVRFFQRRPECTGNSSSDENRSSGHASMSDTGGHTSSSSPPHRHHRSHSPQQLNSVPEDDRLSASVTQRNGRSRSGQNRNRHRATPAKVSFRNASLTPSQEPVQAYAALGIFIASIV